MSKRKADFELASETPGAGSGINPLSAPQMSYSSGIQAPRVQAAHQNPATLNTPAHKSSMISPEVVSQGMSALSTAAMKYRDETDRLYATDAYLRARADAQKALYYTPTEGDKTPVGFMNLQGKDAVDTRGEKQQQIEQIYAQQAASLSPNAKKKYLAISNGAKITALDKVARHTVQQREAFKQQEIYGMTISALRETVKDPMNAYDNELVQQLMGLTAYTPKSQMAALAKIEEVSIDKLLLQSPEAAEAWISKYSVIEGDPQVRVQSLKKIAVAKRARIGNFKDNSAKIQKQLKADAVRAMTFQVGLAARNQDGEGFARAIQDVNTVFGDDPIAAKKRVEEGIDDAMTVSLLGDGTTAHPKQTIAEVEEQWRAILQDASQYNMSLPIGTVAHIQQKLDDLRVVAAQRDKQAEDAATEEFFKNVDWDDDGVASMQNGVTLSMVDPHKLNSKGVKVYNALSKARQKESKAITSLKKQEMNESFIASTVTDANGSISFTGDITAYNYAELTPPNRKLFELAANGLNTPSDRATIDLQKASSAKFRAGIKIDETTGRKVYDGNLSDVDWLNLPSSDRVTFDKLLKAKEQEVKIVGKKLKDHNYNVAMQWFYEGKLAVGGSKRAQVISAQSDPDSAMSQTQFAKIRNLINKADTGKDPKLTALKADVGYKAAMDWIDHIARQGLFSSDMKIKTGEKLYNEKVLDLETVEARVAAKTAVTNYMIQHPDAEPMEVLKEHLAKWKWNRDKPYWFTGDYEAYKPTTAPVSQVEKKAPAQKSVPVVKQASERPEGVPANFKHYQNANGDWWGDKASGAYWDGKSVRGGK